jgi:hypothetical protein
MIKGISLADWISLLIGIFGFLSALAARSSRLPSWARNWLKAIGKDKIEAAIGKAATIADLTPEQRKKEAVIYIQRIALKELGLVVPTSIANLLVEFVYQQWKRRV